MSASIADMAHLTAFNEDDLLTEPTPLYGARTKARLTPGDVGLVTATDADGDTLTYSVAATTDSDGEASPATCIRVLGNDGAPRGLWSDGRNEDWGLDAATGQISGRSVLGTAESRARAIDYETRDTYTVL